MATDLDDVTADRAHGDDDAEHRRHDAETGQSVGDLGQHLRRCHGLGVVLFQLQFQQRLQLMRLDVAADHQAQAVGDEVDQVVVGLHLGVVAEQRALGWAFDVVFQRHEAFAAGLVEQFIEQAEHIDVVLLLVARALEHANHGLQGLLDRLGRRAHQESAERGTADDDQLVGLPEGTQAAVGTEVAPDHADDDDQESNDDEHGATQGEGISPCRPVARISEEGIL